MQGRDDYESVGYVDLLAKEYGNDDHWYQNTI